MDQRQAPEAPTASTIDTPEADFRSHPLQELLDGLPSRISYSSIDIALQQNMAGPSSRHRMLRRDLFDARFQMLLDDDDESAQDSGPAAQYDAQIDLNSDLIPGVYEGGLKTWECALDLVDVLNTMLSTPDGTALHSKHVLELGCGTALPSLYLLEKLLEDKKTHDRVTLHLADYNAQVLSLVTLPNLILAWWNSSASAQFRTGSGAEISAQEQEDLRRRGQDHFDTEGAAQNAVDVRQRTGELSISLELLSAFTQSLDEHNIELRFYSGGWSTFPKTLTSDGSPIDIILTSETIYSLPSLPALVDLLHLYAAPAPNAAARPVCLVAAKVIYFGVGGGVELFKQHAVSKAARISAVKNVTQGVGRTVLLVEF